MRRSIVPMESSSFLLVLVLAVGWLALAAGCRSAHDVPRVTPGIRTVGFPPLPPGLATKVYCTTERTGSGCLSRQHGKQACLDRLRATAALDLAQVVGSTVLAAERLASEEKFGAEERELLEELRAELDASVHREFLVPIHESPLFREADGGFVAMFCVVRGEADWAALETLELNANHGRDTARLDVLRRLKRSLFPRGPMGPAERDAVVERLFTFYHSLWNAVRTGEERSTRGSRERK